MTQFHLEEKSLSELDRFLASTQGERLRALLETPNLSLQLWPLQGRELNALEMRVRFLIFSDFLKDGGTLSPVDLEIAERLTTMIEPVGARKCSVPSSRPLILDDAGPDWIGPDSPLRAKGILKWSV